MWNLLTKYVLIQIYNFIEKESACVMCFVCKDWKYNLNEVKKNNHNYKEIVQLFYLFGQLFQTTFNALIRITSINLFFILIPYLVSG